MLRRWLIRASCLLALTLIVTAWVLSHRGVDQVFKWSGGHVWAVGMAPGICFAYRYDMPDYPNQPLEYRSYAGFSARDFFAVDPVLGFYCGRVPFSYSLLITFPLWLPTLLLAILNAFVWRKTRRPRVGTGFPVEPALNTNPPSNTCRPVR
jgi:hypothetical protein